MTADTPPGNSPPGTVSRGRARSPRRQRRPARPHPTTTATETGKMILALYILTLMLGSIAYAIWTEIDQHRNDR